MAAYLAADSTGRARQVGGDLPTSPLLERVRRGISGEGEADGPFAPPGVTSADSTPSGWSLDFIEDFIRDAVLPRYVGGTEDGLVIFCGSGVAARRETDIHGHSASNYLTTKDIRPSPVWDLGPFRPLRMTLPPCGRPDESQMDGLVSWPAMRRWRNRFACA